MLTSTQDIKLSEETKKRFLDNHHVRLMRKEDISQCQDIFKEHGFTPSTGSMTTLFTIDPKGSFVVSSNDENGKEIILAFCISSKHDPRIAIIGFYGTRKGYQGLGLGSKAWKEMMKTNLFSSPVIGLTASQEALKMYQEKAGFVVKDPRGMLVFKTQGKIEIAKINPGDSSTIKVVPLKDASWNDLITYDESVIGFNRDKFLELCLNEDGTHCCVAIDVTNNKVVGFAAVKPTIGDTCAIGPLYSKTTVIARVLLHSLLSTYQPPTSNQNGLKMYATDDNLEAIRLAKDLGMECSNITVPRILTSGELTGVRYEEIFGLVAPFGFY